MANFMLHGGYGELEAEDHAPPADAAMSWRSHERLCQYV